MRNRRRRFSSVAADDDPLSLVPNLFDVSIVLAVAFLVATLSVAGQRERGTASPGQIAKGLRKAAETVVRQSGGKSLQRPTDRKAGGRGSRLGVAYQLENGEIIYVPD